MNLYGWDAVYVASTDVINPNLVSYTQAHPQTLTISTEAISVDCKLGQWSISSGGSGSLVNVDITIESGTATISSQQIPLQNIVLQFQIQVELLPAAGSSGATNLCFNLTGSSATSSSNPVTYNNQMTNIPSSLDSFHQTILGNALASAINQNSAGIDFILAEVNPASDAKVAWMTPTSSSFAYVEPEGSSVGVFAIFTTTQNRSSAGLLTQLDGAWLSDGATVGAAISSAMFLENIFANILASSLNATASDFATSSTAQFLAQAKTEASSGAASNPVIKELIQTLDNEAASGEAILNATVPIALQGIKKGAITYDPIVTAATATLSDTTIQVAINGSCSLKLGMNLTFSSSSVITATYDSSKGTISFALQGSPTFTSSKSIPWYDYALATIAAFIGEALLQVITTAVGDAVANGIQSVTGNIAVGNAATNTVIWGGAAPFSVSKGTLECAFYMEGTIAS